MGEAKANFNRMLNGMFRLKEISENAAGDQFDVEKYVKEFADVCTEMFRATGCVFEQEHGRFINMVAPAGNGATDGGGGGFPRSPTENKVIQNLRDVKGDNPCSGNGTKNPPRRSGKVEAYMRR